VVPGSNAAAARRRSVASRASTASGLRPEGSALWCGWTRLPGQAGRIPRFQHPGKLEMMQTNGKERPAYQTGGCRKRTRPGRSTTWAFDGGGIDTNGDGQRVNATCPGTACDTVPRSSSACWTTASARTPELLPDRHGGFRHHPHIPSATHRKVHSIINARRGPAATTGLPSGRRQPGNGRASVWPRWRDDRVDLRCVALGNVW